MIPTPTRVLFARGHVDFRKSIDGLAAVVELALDERALSGTLFVFLNKRRNAVKLLMWHHGGFVLVYKRLEKGCFRPPLLPERADRVALTAAELGALLEGIDMAGAKRLSRWNPPDFP